MESLMKRKIMRVAAVASTVAVLSLMLAAPAQAYAKNGCSWGSPNVNWFYSGQDYGDFKASADEAANNWNVTHVKMTHLDTGPFKAYIQDDGNSGYSGWTEWECSSTQQTTKAESHLNTHDTVGVEYGEKVAIWAHEFGHGLGLNHSTPGNIMFSCAGCTYQDFGKRNKPQEDDRNGINSLY
ncbi:matrixin family metalloprotease [Rathayibacter toxicus]|uniref:matrixin family metalloprotease n=1 Tax=Rathayibacter toxicus TaxID=145458 RepID=UPI001C043637|nr:matrixin family metalloprotease [Rathayibacter toxicus]QWL30235.1 matrixin family metalloprotease [Rathayibacter toxicus]